MHQITYHVTMLFEKILENPFPFHLCSQTPILKIKISYTPYQNETKMNRNYNQVKSLSPVTWDNSRKPISHSILFLGPYTFLKKKLFKTPHFKNSKKKSKIVITKFTPCIKSYILSPCYLRQLQKTHFTFNSLPQTPYKKKPKFKTLQEQKPKGEEPTLEIGAGPRGLDRWDWSDRTKRKRVEERVTHWHGCEALTVLCEECVKGLEVQMLLFA